MTNVTVGEAYERGRLAYSGGKPIKANPFHHQRHKHENLYEMWRHGWEDAKHEVRSHFFAHDAGKPKAEKKPDTEQGGTIVTGRKLNRDMRRKMLSQMGYARNTIRKTKVPVQFVRLADPVTNNERREINIKILKNQELRKVTKAAAEDTMLTAEWEPETEETANAA